MKYISLNWTLALKFSIGKKKRMSDCRILMAHDCIYKNIKSTFYIPNECCCIILTRPDGRLVKLFLFPTLLDKFPLTSVYFATFEKKREVRSPLPHYQTFWFLVNYKYLTLC